MFSDSIIDEARAQLNTGVKGPTVCKTIMEATGCSLKAAIDLVTAIRNGNANTRTVAFLKDLVVRRRKEMVEIMGELKEAYLQEARENCTFEEGDRVSVSDKDSGWLRDIVVFIGVHGVDVESDLVDRYHTIYDVTDSEGNTRIVSGRDYTFEKVE